MLMQVRLPDELFARFLPVPKRKGLNLSITKS